MSAEIWLLDDDASIRFVLSETLRDAGYRVRSFDSVQLALAALQSDAAPDLLFTDIRMPTGSGLDFLARAKQEVPNLPIVVMSAFTDVGNTSSAYRGGATEYLAKPFDLDDVLALVERALPNAVDEYKALQDAAPHEQKLLGKTARMRELFRQIGRLAQLPQHVCISGEMGVGKTRIAQALHQESIRRAKPLIRLNLANMASDIQALELFGQEQGSGQKRLGRIEQAHAGCLWLDGIEHMPMEIQRQFLRVLRDGELIRVGGQRIVHVDVRVFVGTRLSIENKIASGQFSDELWQHLNSLRILVPALRQRIEDIALLAEYFLQRIAAQLGTKPKTISKALLDLMRDYSWPGNVRELENRCWQMASCSSNAQLGIEDWIVQTTTSMEQQSWQQGLKSEMQQQLLLGETQVHARYKEHFELALFDAALHHCKGNRVQAAELLGLSRNTLSRKLGSKKFPKETH